MIPFARQAFSVLDRPARVRFVMFALCSVLVAILEAVGVALIVPLTEILLDADGEPQQAVRLVTRFTGVTSSGQAAAVLAAAVLVAFVLKALAAIALLRWAIGTSLREEARLARNLFSRYLTAPATYHMAHNSAEIQRTLNESMLIVFRRSLPWVMASAADAFTLAAIAGVIVLSDISVAALAIAYFAAIGVLYQRWIGGRHKVAARQAHQEVALRYQQVQEPMRATMELAVLHRNDFFVSRFYRTKLELAEAQRTLLFHQLLPRQFLDLALVIGVALMSWFLFATRPTEAALASIGLFLTASFRLVAPLNRVLGAFTVARSAEPAIEQVIHDLTLLERLQRPSDDAAGKPMKAGTIEVSNVRLAYADDLEDVLRGISLTIEPGEDVAIIGSTGAGKSTLLSVIMGVLRPHAGSVRVGDQPLEKRLTDWQLSIGYVPQDVVLIDDTVRANVAFGVDAEEVAEADLWEALQLAQVDEFVASLPEGLDTGVGEYGMRLSGGQRQRLGLARALYHRPNVLVLDEATSSLDSETEARVIDTIARLRRSLTIITVSHRLSTLKHCDRIYLLQNGEIGAVGNFEELRASSPEFEHLVNLAELTRTDALREGRDLGRQRRGFGAVRTAPAP